MRLARGALLLVGLTSLAATARAQTSEYSDLADETVIESPEWGVWEIISVGPYQPTAIAEADPPLESLADDNGPLLSTEVDVFLFRIPYVGPLGAGVRAGWAKYEGPTIDETTGEEAAEDAKVVIFPITPLASLRVDVLARELNFPLVFTGKIGLQLIPWNSKKGGQLEEGGSNVEIGLRWSAQVALELDFLEPDSARRLDEEWGINHSFIFGELFGSTADLFGDPLAWTMGLGFVY
ncbi:MAG: MXAN_2562 family outer membrane beta-barrel protein [Myxococcota bacterium]